MICERVKESFDFVNGYGKVLVICKIIVLGLMLLGNWVDNLIWYIDMNQCIKDLMGVHLKWNLETIRNEADCF